LLGAYNYHKPSPFEGFDVGGDGMSGYNVYGVEIIGLRGYDDSSITPISPNGDYARAYNKYTIELRYPIVLQPASQIYALAFTEGGNAFQTIKKMNPFEVKRSAGVGVRLFLSVVGMLGLDWGYGFDVVPGTGKKGGSQLHFMIGQTF
jgi:outer membrane protein insertion porin family